MRLIGIMLACFVFFGVGCDSESEQRAGQTQDRGAVQEFAEIAKVKVDRAGTIYFNGKTVTTEELKQEFARLKQSKGAVWYYRENPQGEPSAQAMEVIQAIVDAQLPVKLLEKDFD
ncbi:MAG: hypothetical protein ACE5FE_07035 [Acidiferrobacterales bacterium]